jgi:hydrogenase-4 component H
MSIASKLKEARLSLKAGRVTLSYPAHPRPAPPSFRGRPIFDPRKCIGCGGCASNCPAREILIFDPCQEIRILKYLGRRCSYCGRCAEVCPEKAITMSLDYETATDRVADLQQRLDLFMGTCQRCGRCFEPKTPLDRLKLRGYRVDDLEKERWVFRSQSYLEKEPPVGDLSIELED